MQTSVLISGLVLLIPFLYASASIPDACAAIRDTNYDSGSCTGDKTSKAGKTCCWREKVPGELLGKTMCQTCWIESDSKGSYERCTSPTEQAFKLPETDRTNPLQKDGVLEKQNDLPKFNQEDSKLGTILEEQKSNVTFSEQNETNDK